MARMGTTFLDAGDPFPQMTLRLVDGGRLTLPHAAAQGWCMVLIYRGHW